MCNRVLFYFSMLLFLLLFSELVTASSIQTGAGVIGGTCTNQVVTAISTTAIPTCTTITSAYADATIVKSAAAATFTGAFTFTATLTNTTAVTFPTSGTLATTAQLPTVTGGTCTNQVVTAISSSVVPTCTTITSAYTTGLAILGANTFTGAQTATQFISATGSAGAPGFTVGSGALLIGTGTGNGSNLQFVANGTGRWNVQQSDGSFQASSGNGGSAYVGNGVSSGTAPVFSFIGDTTTGMGRQAVGKVSLIGAGTEIARFSSAGMLLGGYIQGSSATPVATGCGTSPATTGSLITGTITEGSIATGCTVTFATAPVHCIVTSEAGLVFTYSLSAAVMTITNIGALSSTNLDYFCGL